jgi:hypothetical protein
MPCQHALAGMPHAYIAPIGIAEDRTGFPCGECRGGATLDRVLYRQVHRSGQLVHWSRNSAFREGGSLCDISVDAVANKLKRPATEAPAQALGRSGVGELSDQQSPWYRSN